MKINTALILCAGFGKRLNPTTLHTPKPLLKIKDLTLFDNCIKLIESLNIKKILINSFHLKEQINEFVKNHNYDIEIKVIEDGDNILDKVIDGKKTQMSLKFIYPQGKQFYKDVVQILKDEAERVGVHIDMVSSEWSVMQKDLNNKN